VRFGRSWSHPALSRRLGIHTFWIVSGGGSAIGVAEDRAVVDRTLPLTRYESKEGTRWRVLRVFGGSASMDEVLQDVMLVLVALALFAMLWRQLKRHLLLRRADRISRSIRDGDAAAGDRHFKQLLAAYRLARAKSHLNGGENLYPAAEALVSEFRMRQLEKRSPSFS
jgi:hypothetical protein